MRTLILLAICLAAGGASCIAEPLREVTLVRTACRGTCPYYHVTLRSDGRVDYHGFAHVGAKGIRKKKIDPAAFETVWAKIEEIGFWGLEDSYTRVVTKMPDGTVQTTEVSDLPEKRITVVDRTQKKTVIDYFGGPKSLEELELLIDRVADISVWVRGKK
jgi:hypothetical protein